MPRMDGTGPMGMGPMTGGGFGLCSPSGRPYARWGFGRGRGFRRGFGPGLSRGGRYGRGFGWQAGYGPAYGIPNAMDPKEEVNLLKDEADALRSELDAINKRMEDLESQASSS